MQYSSNIEDVAAAMRHKDIRTGFIHSGEDILKEHRRYNQMIIDHYAAKGEVPPCTRLGSGTK